MIDIADIERQLNDLTQKHQQTLSTLRMLDEQTQTMREQALRLEGAKMMLESMLAAEKPQVSQALEPEVMSNGTAEVKPHRKEKVKV
jgi:hypothetical protein